MACDAQAAITGGRCFCLGAKQVECIRVYLLALWAGLSTDPNTLAGLASSLGGLNVKDRAQIDTYLLSVIAGASSDPNTLAAAAKGFVIDGRQHQYYQIQDSLLCSLAGASCVPNTLATLARGFDGYGYEQLGQVATYCLAVKAGVSTSANALLALAKGFQGTPLKMLFQEQAWLLCGLAAGGMDCTTAVAVTNLVSTPERGSSAVTYRVVVSWDAFAHPEIVASYTSLRQEFPEGEFAVAATSLIGTAVQLTDSGTGAAGPVLAGVDYGYILRTAFNNGCQSIDTSAIATGQICLPGVVTPGNDGFLDGSNITINWSVSPNNNPLLDWVITYGVDPGGPYPFSHTVTPTARSAFWTDANVADGDAFFVITKRDAATCTTSSDEVHLSQV